jgi:hypothetical protein
MKCSASLLRCGISMRKLVAAFALTFLTLAPFGARAAFDVGSSGLNESAGEDGAGFDTSTGNIALFIGSRIIQPVLGILGLLFLVLTIYAGILWMTAQGDPKQVQKAKDILVSAVIGVVIIVAAYALTTAVFNGLTTGSLTGNATSPSDTSGVIE